MNGSPSGKACGSLQCRRASSARLLHGGPVRAMLAVLACMAVLGACIVEGKLGIHLVNDLGKPVEIVYLVDPEIVVGRLGTNERDDTDTFDFLRLEPGAPPDTEACTTADVVARALDGRVLARIPPPVCYEGTGIGLSSFPGP